MKEATTNVMMKFWLASWLVFSCCLLAWPCSAGSGQADRLRQLARRPQPPANFDAKVAAAASSAAPPYVVPQDGRSKEDDRVVALPGQPGDVDFEQYAGYVTVDSGKGRALFYYFVESPQDASAKPLVLWLNGGPGCSSLGFGAMAELGPFRVNIDDKTLFINEYAWNNVANVLFLESPAGVGFSYSNSSSDYDTTGDRTAADAYVFLINWLERFPQYKGRDFYITGGSFAGHYVPELAHAIISNTRATNQTGVNLKGIAIGNAYLDGYFTKVDANTRGKFDYYWGHALISDEAYAALVTQCKYPNGNYTRRCLMAMDNADGEMGNIDRYSIYAPRCHGPRHGNRSTGSVATFDPCSGDVKAYLNLQEVKAALHVSTMSLSPWSHCSDVVGYRNWRDMQDSMLPTIQDLIRSGLRIWLYSGDTDAVVPFTSTKYSINMLDLPIRTPWRPWLYEEEVGGYVVEYQGLTFATVRGAGHEVPTYQPGRSLTLFVAFLHGEFPLSP